MSERRFEWDRRGFLKVAGAAAATAAAGALLPRTAWADSHAGGDAVMLPAAAAEGLTTSPLVYVSPLKSDGAESTCHGEVWFVRDGDDALVVTAHDRWKAVAVGRGLTKTRLWVGDHGVWKNSGGKFRSSPTWLAAASVEADPKAHTNALATFGEKYPAEWDKWGPRFKNGLADGSRVMLRYTPIGT